MLVKGLSDASQPSTARDAGKPRRKAFARASTGACLALLLHLGACGGSVSPIAEAAALADKGQEREAIRLLKDHLYKYPDAVRERRMLVRLYGATGQIGSAEREVRELARRLPADSPIPLIELGHVLELGHRYGEALALYDQAAEAAPADPSGPKTGGLRAARWGEPALAAPRLEEALRRQPGDAEAWHALGLVRLHLGDLPGARRAYENGLKAEPDALENRIGLATVALKERDARAALEQYDLVIAERPRFADAHLGRSWALILLGRFDQARTAIATAHRMGADRSVVVTQSRLLRRLENRAETKENR